MSIFDEEPRRSETGDVIIGVVAWLLIIASVAWMVWLGVRR